MLILIIIAHVYHMNHVYVLSIDGCVARGL